MAKKEKKTFRATITYKVEIDPNVDVTGKLSDEKKFWKDELAGTIESVLGVKPKFTLEEVE